MVSSVPYSHLWPYGFSPVQGPVTPVIQPLRPEKESANTGEKQGETTGFDHRRPSQGLASMVDQQQKQRIRLDSVLVDFRNTISALGAEPQIQEEVDVYLKAIEIQGQKPQPDVTYIRQTLKTSAKVLDQFITLSLKQPSKVVSDWVDALLLQSIDYHLEGMSGVAGANLNKSTLSQEQAQTQNETQGQHFQEGASGESSVFQGSITQEYLDDGERISTLKTQLKGWVNSSREALQQKQPEKALNYLNQAIPAAETLEASEPNPSLLGKLWKLKAQAQTQSGQWSEALNSLSEAELCFDDAGDLHRCIGVNRQQAELFSRLNQSQRSIERFEAALDRADLLGNPETVAQLLNELGMVYLQQGQTPIALESWQEALALAQNSGLQELTQAIHHNLGGGYLKSQQYEVSVQHYQDAFKQARLLRDTEGASLAQLRLREVYAAWQGLKSETVV